LKKLRSAEWFDSRDEMGPQNRAVLRALGWTPEFFTGKPVIGIANSWSELNNCNLNLREVAEAVKRGVTAAGGVPLEFNTISLGEKLMKPSAMLYRNLMAMEVEEMLRAHPLDGVVLLSGCDKTTPAQLMAAASADLPAIQVCAGPKSPGWWNGQEIGSETDLWRYWEQYRNGRLSAEDWQALEAAFGGGCGTCNSMGTASTMAILSEALGMMLPGTSTIPATDARRKAVAEASGRRAVQMVYANVRPSQILTRKAFENALRVFAAIGGSANAAIHLIAIAGRIRIPLSLDDFDHFSRTTPLILDLQPSGMRLMGDFDNAGGLPALMYELRELLHLDLPTVGGLTVEHSLARRASQDENHVIRSRANPIHASGGLAVLRGNLAPRGAVLRQSAASQRLLRHSGPALVFDNYADLKARLDDPKLPATADSVLVLRNGGAVGALGLPEWGAIPIPKKLQRQGVTDMVRISDSRVSNISFGTVILHVTPEAAVGGPLALVQDGDLIELDVPQRKLNLLVSDEELASRKESWRSSEPLHKRGYPRLFCEHVLQPDEGCDFDFLRPTSESEQKFILPVVGQA
jgi:L-arabonate dehydrase